MPLSIDQIKVLKTVNLEPFEIRGAKSGIGNARTTGPLHTSGSYIPAYGTLYGDASFSADSSVVTDLSFNPPYVSFDTTALKLGDTLIFGSSHLIAEIVDQTTVWLDSTAGITGTADFTASLVPRDYLIEPDKARNTFSGEADFTSGSVWVYGQGTSWLTDLTASDYIRRDYQQFYRIQQVVDDTSLKLVTAYSGSSGTGSFTARKQLIDQMYYRYTKDAFYYEKNGGFWAQDDGTTGSNLLATTYPAPMADGVNLQFVHSIDPKAPDLMDTNTAQNLTLTRRTMREVFQYPLPAVPNPEKSFELKINDNVVTNGQDYVINYSQDPIYIPPPAPEERQVANLMFLAGISNQPLSGISNGNLKFVDSTGNSVTGAFSGTETIWLDGTVQRANYDYLLDADPGVAVMSSAVINEPIVKYVGVDISDLMDYGISTYLDGRKLRYNIPQKDTDEVRMAQEVGRVVPVGLEHPAPGDEYIVNYQVTGAAVTSETIQVTAGVTSFRVSQYPLKDNSLILVKNGEILDEDTDFRVSAQTGRVILTESLVTGDSISVSYYPLVKQVNGLSYSGQWYCTSYGSQLLVVSAPGFEFSLADYALDPREIKILRVYNDTKNKDYDLNGLTATEYAFKLAANPINVAIGLTLTDLVTVDYKFESETLEYFPMVFSNYSVLQDSTRMFLQAVDARTLFPEGAVVKASPSNADVVYSFLVKKTIYDGEDTEVDFCSRVPEDIINPKITVSDASVTFNLIDATAQSLVAGSTSLSFPEFNRPDLFRPFSVLKIANSESYGVVGATYTGEATVVSLSSALATDWTSSDQLSSVMISDCPVYDEGTTNIVTSKPVITTPEQTGLEISYQASGTAFLSTDFSSLNVVTDATSYRFPWDDFATLGDMSNGLSAVGVFNVTAYTPDWTSSRLKPVSSKSVWMDSSTRLPILTTLRLDGTTTGSFQIVNEQILFDSALEPGQRYSLDYVGRDFLGNATASYSTRYFTLLPVRSKLSASFQYDNLDQFYVQVMTERQFLDEVIIPAVDEENAQLAGGGGQGGDLLADQDLGNAEGGLTNDWFRQRDYEIWCRTYENIYDYFSDRAQALGDEIYSAFGYRLCNNDGLLSKYEQGMISSKAFNRLWPNSDWTSYQPDYVAPLTGATQGPGLARFTNGSPTVSGVVGPDGLETEWAYQNALGAWIRPANGTKDYVIGAVTGSPGSEVITLLEPYDGPTSPSGGEEFTLTSKFPTFDDDGYFGPKIAGTQTAIRPKLENGDVFSCDIDGTTYSSTFNDPTFPPPLSRQTRLKKYTMADAAQNINEDIPNLNATVEWIFDADAAYGYKEVMVLRTNRPYNRLSINGSGAANVKLGFTADMSSTGSYNFNDSSSEIDGLSDERVHLVLEQSPITEIIDLGILPKGTKLDRSSALADPFLSAILPEISDQTTAIYQQLSRLSEEISVLEFMLSEPGRPDAVPTQVALNNAHLAVADCSAALLQDGSMLSNWMGTGSGRTWALDLTSGRQDIRGKNDLNNVGDPFDGPYPIVSIKGLTDFILEVPAGYDRRIMNAPDIRYLDTSSVVPGSWTGWDNSGSLMVFTIAPIGVYSSVVSTDSTKLTLDWEEPLLTPHTAVFPYSTYPTVGSIKAAIDALPEFSATGSASYDSYNSSLADSSQVIGVGAPIYLRGVDERYSINNQITFTIDPSELFTIGHDADKTSPYVTTGSTSLTIGWLDSSGNNTVVFPYGAYTTVGTMKTAIDALSGFDVAGSASYDSYESGYKLGTVYLNPRAGVYLGLKDCFVDYQTISDKKLADRTDYIIDRISEIDARSTYLNGTRRGQIVQTALNEELFRATDGGMGNLYVWANNRFNRVQGCEAKLFQTKQLIARNTSALTVNRTLA